MKKKWLFLPIFILIFVFTLIPASFISANPGNLVTNGDFSDGLNNWVTIGNVFVINEEVTIDSTMIGVALIEQDINTTKKNLIYSFDVNPSSYGTYGILAGFFLNEGIINLGYAFYYYNSLPLNTWSSISFNILDCWDFDFHGMHPGAPMPDFSEISIRLDTYDGCIAKFDNVKLTYPEGAATSEPEPWIRGDRQMTCSSITINEDNIFQLSFIYPYADNNWVRFYSINPGEMVYEIDMPYDNPNIIVDLPDGMYTVKTFHDQPEPLQEFIIGKP